MTPDPQPIHAVPQATTDPQERFDALYETLGWLFGPASTHAERSTRGKIAIELTELDVEPADVVDRAHELLERFGDPKFVTERSLLKHWSRKGGVIGQMTTDDVDRYLVSAKSQRRYDRLLEVDTHDRR